VIVSAARAVPRSLEHKGVRHFLPKPFDVEQLARSVAEAVASTVVPQLAAATQPVPTEASWSIGA
jgi:FixJ family two-component response regulator